MKENKTDLGMRLYLSEETMQTEEKTVVKEEEQPCKVLCPRELHELRGLSRKVFHMSDGTKRAIYYPEPIHVYNAKTGSFDEVSPEMILSEDKKKYKSTRSDFEAIFSCNQENEELFEIEKGMHRISVFAKRSKKNQMERIVPKQRKKDAILFENVMPNADFEYTMTHSGVKENIIVKEKSDVYRFAFYLQCENVSPRFDESAKKLVFLSEETGKEVFYIPAPFMKDANDEVSTSVFYEVKNITDKKLQLTVIADSDWINAEERVFPVLIDPQVKISGIRNLTTYSWSDEKIYNDTRHRIGTSSDSGCKKNRMYMSVTLPTLPHNPRIQKAELTLTQHSITSDGCCPKIGLYKVTEPISTGTITPNHSADLLDFEVLKSVADEGDSNIIYHFDITKLIDECNQGGDKNVNLMVKLLDETCSSKAYTTVFGAENASLAPQLMITYDSTYGVNSSYRTHTHELGTTGQGSVDLACGNLMFEWDDFTWAGNRMPVTMKHFYNSALSDQFYTQNTAIELNTVDYSNMKLGLGWKLNLMQSMLCINLDNEGNKEYCYIDANGQETRLTKNAKKNLYEDANGQSMSYDPETFILTMGEEKHEFDESGKLIRISDGRNQMNFCYTDGKLTSVTDGAGREFGFNYAGQGFLTSVSAPDDTQISYSYTGNLLTGIIYPDGRSVTIDYELNKPRTVTLCDENGQATYRVEYTFAQDFLCRVKEYGVRNGAFVPGADTTYSYSAAARRTIVETTEQADADEGETEDQVVKLVYTFNEEGEVTSEYTYTEDTGNVALKESGNGIHPFAGEGGAGVVSNINNFLRGHNFESLDEWVCLEGNCANMDISCWSTGGYAHFGSSFLRMETCCDDCHENGIYQITNTLPEGEYTFSAYARVTTAYIGECKGIYLRVKDADGNLLCVSEKLFHAESNYQRLAVSFTLTSSQCVYVEILADGKGTVYVDGAQLEDNPYVNDYNMVTNGNFENGTAYWKTVGGVYVTDTEHFNMSDSLMMDGEVDDLRTAHQDIRVRSERSTRETFTLSGWAKGYGLVKRERAGAKAPRFALRAEIHYWDNYYKYYETEEVTAEFSPCTEEWQLASIQFTKSEYRVIDFIRVYCDYSYNFGTAYFDDIQLVRNSVETGLTEDAFGKGASGDEADAGSEVSAEDTAKPFEEFQDDYGNALTETTFTDGEFGTIYRSFGFDSENVGNDLVRETDARGNTTLYDVDAETSRNTEVTDRCGNKTAYEYDEAGKTSKVVSKDASGNVLAEVSYGYDSFDNMTEIVRGDGMKYVLSYNAFHNLESIGVEGHGSLVEYVYKDGNGRLKQITYANGDAMKATYNRIGQMTAERWYDASNNEINHYKYVYDGQGNIVRSIDIKSNKEYNYYYENGRLMRATECQIEVNTDGIVVKKDMLSTIFYAYDSEDRLSRKRIVFADGKEHVVYYETPDDSNTVAKFVIDEQTVTSHSKTDSFGRKVFDELQIGKGFVSRQFDYHIGEITEEHAEHGKIKSSPTTQLVDRIVLSDHHVLSYEYDKEERITKVTDSLEGQTDDVTEYTYDALGQLLTETRNGVPVNVMTYDNYGNILTKNGVTYGYEGSGWKDRLVSVGDKTITYDAQGNPTNYLGKTLTWEKGRQLKSFGEYTYTYNANGIRTSKTVGINEHKYTLDGTSILRETWGENTLIPLYDNEESVCGILYNDNPFYFLKNLQGDIIAIVDQEADVVARYSYDAWGVCTIVSDTTQCSIANINPYRYRGYYYDTETKLYYLQSRYYDPEIGRFVNADDVELAVMSQDIIEHNAFAYCGNNCVNDIDEMGTFSLKKVWNTFKKVLSKLKSSFEKYINSLIVLKNKMLKISTFVIAKVIDGIIDTIISYVIARTLKTVIKTALLYFSQKSKYKLVEFVKSFLRFLIENKFGKIILSIIVKKAVKKANKRENFADSLIKDYLTNMLANQSKLIRRISSIISAFSSLGGMIAFALDHSDGNWDDYFIIKLS